MSMVTGVNIVCMGRRSYELSDDRRGDRKENEYENYLR